MRTNFFCTQIITGYEALCACCGCVLSTFDALYAGPFFIWYINDVFLNWWIVAILMVWRAAAVTEYNLVCRWACSTVTHLTHRSFYISSIRSPLFGLSCRFGYCRNKLNWLIDRASRLRLCRQRG